MKKLLTVFLICTLMLTLVPAVSADPIVLPKYELVGKSGFADEFEVDASGNLLWTAALRGLGEDVGIASMTIWLTWDNTQLELISYSAAPIHFLDINGNPDTSRPLTNAEPDIENANEFCYALARAEGGWFEPEESEKLFTLTFKVADGLAEATDCNLTFTKFQLGLTDASGAMIDTSSYELSSTDGCITTGVLPKAKCTVNHYTEALNGEFELNEAVEVLHPIGFEYTAKVKELEGFTFDATAVGTALNGMVTADGLLSLNLYYTRNSYKMSYYIDGELYTEMWVAFEQRVVLITEPTPPEGMSFSGWSEIPPLMPAQAVRVDGSFSTLALNGDADCNGFISAQDASEVLRHVVRLRTLTGQGAINADADHNGTIAATDATLILRYLVRLIPTL